MKALTEDKVMELLEPPRWRVLEQWLRQNKGQFTARHLAASMGVDRLEASHLIQSYLIAQRGKHPETGYVLKRRGRTRSAVWSIGKRIPDAHAIGVSFSDDVIRKALRAFAPDLERIAATNPQAARYCESKIEAVLEGALKVLVASVDGMARVE